MERILYTSKAKVTFSAAERTQIHYGVIEVEDGYQATEVMTSSPGLPEQIRELLKSKLYSI